MPHEGKDNIYFRPNIWNQTIECIRFAVQKPDPPHYHTVKIFKSALAKRLYKAVGMTILAFALSSVLLAPFSFSASTLVSAPEKNDFEMTDFYAIVADARLVRTLDPDIVIVNIDNCNRNAIADVLTSVASCNPAVVGLDVMFSDPREGDEYLLAAIAECPDLILPVGVKATGDDRFELSDTTFFHSSVKEWPMGVTNLPTKYERGTVREFVSEFTLSDDGGKIPSFAVAIAKKYSPEAVERLSKRGRTTELINYPSLDYRVFSPEEVADNAKSLNGKIVLIGAMTEQPDLHPTPIHSQLPGVGIHARAISTILSGKYITRVSFVINWLIAFFLCMTVVMAYISITGRTKSLIMRLLQLGLLYLIIVCGYICYIEYAMILDLSYALLMITFGLFACDIWVGCVAIGQNIYSKYLSKRLKKLNINIKRV